VPTIAVANTDADLSSRTIVTEEGAYTIEGLHTYDRDPNPPFAVSANSAAVANLIADDVDAAATSYTPTWTNGSIGNGTLTGSYLQIGDLVVVWIYMLAGGTTTFGAGSAWTFSLPVTAASANLGVGSALIQDTGTAFFVGTVSMATTTTITIHTNNAASAVINNVPHAWASTDLLKLVFAYPAA
jgi:hypothetical protein